jgi:hypothetical protein
MATDKGSSELFARIVVKLGSDNWAPRDPPHSFRVGNVWEKAATEEDLLTEAMRTFLATFAKPTFPPQGTEWEVEVFFKLGEDSERILASGIVRLQGAPDAGDTVFLVCRPLEIAPPAPVEEPYESEPRKITIHGLSAEELFTGDQLKEVISRVAQAADPAPSIATSDDGTRDYYHRHPSGVRCIEIIEHMPLNVGTAMKYLWRCDEKHPDPVEDLTKALWYVQREIERRNKMKEAT